MKSQHQFQILKSLLKNYFENTVTDGAPFVVLVSNLVILHLAATVLPPSSHGDIEKGATCTSHFATPKKDSIKPHSCSVKEALAENKGMYTQRQCSLA